MREWKYGLRKAWCLYRTGYFKWLYGASDYIFNKLWLCAPSPATPNMHTHKGEKQLNKIQTKGK